MTVELSPEIWHRDDFSLLCNWRKLFRAIEIGVDRGEFAQEFLQHWRGHNFMGVDPFTPYPEMPWDREADYLMAVTRFERHAKRAKLVRMESVALANMLRDSETKFFDGPLVDFIYIDGDHRYEPCRADIAAWWPRLSDFGILAGHDFDHNHPGVMRAVSEFAESHGLTIYLTKDDPCSWYIYKSGMPGPEWRRA